MLYNRSQVVVVTLLEDAVEAQLDPGYAVATEHEVRMLLSTGRTVDGRVRVYRPVGRDRLSDYARAPEMFRYVETDGRDSHRQQRAYRRAPGDERGMTIEQVEAPRRNTAFIDGLFRLMCQQGASDLHLAVGLPPMIRKDGHMQPLDPAAPVLDAAMVVRLLDPITPDKNRQEFAEKHDTDFAYEIPGLARFRANMFMDRKGRWRASSA